MKNYSYLIVFLLFLSPGVLAQDTPESLVELPLGSRVSREGIQKIMNARNVAQFIESIVGEDLHVVAINRRESREVITVPLQYGMDISGEMTTYFIESSGKTGSLYEGIYVMGGESTKMLSWNRVPVILVQRTISLKSLMHEYLHHLMHENPDNRFYSFVHNRRISFLALRESQMRYEELQERFNHALRENSTMSLRARSLGDEYAMIHDMLLLIRGQKELAEIEIELFFIRNRTNLNLSRDDISTTLGYISANLETLRHRLSRVNESVRTHYQALLRSLNMDERQDYEDLYNKFIELVNKTRATVSAVSGEIDPLDSGEYRVIEGDANFDGTVDDKDRRFISRAISDPNMTMNFSQRFLSDIDQDGEITEEDLFLLDYLLGRGRRASREKGLQTEDGKGCGKAIVKILQEVEIGEPPKVKVTVKDVNLDVFAPDQLELYLLGRDGKKSAPSRFKVIQKQKGTYEAKLSLSPDLMREKQLVIVKAPRADYPENVLSAPVGLVESLSMRGKALRIEPDGGSFDISWLIKEEKDLPRLVISRPHDDSDTTVMSGDFYNAIEKGEIDPQVFSDLSNPSLFTSEVTEQNFRAGALADGGLAPLEVYPPFGDPQTYERIPQAFRPAKKPKISISAKEGMSVSFKIEEKFLKPVDIKGGKIASWIKEQPVDLRWVYISGDGSELSWVTYPKEITSRPFQEKRKIKTLFKIPGKDIQKEICPEGVVDPRCPAEI